MDVFLGAGRYTRRHCYDCCYDHCAARADNKWSKIYSQLKKLSQIESMRQLRLAHKAGTKINLFNSMMGGIDSRKATNPRDSVFGVLGLVKEDNRSAIDVNYDLSVAEVYSQAAAKIMQDTGNLHLLTFADPQADETLKLPPWCYDWGTTSLFDPNPYGRELFTACSGGRTEVKLHPNPLRMIRRCGRPSLSLY